MHISTIMRQTRGVFVQKAQDGSCTLGYLLFFFIISGSLSVDDFLAQLTCLHSIQSTYHYGVCLLTVSTEPNRKSKKIKKQQENWLVNSTATSISGGGVGGDQPRDILQTTIRYAGFAYSLCCPEVPGGEYQPSSYSYKYCVLCSSGSIGIRPDQLVSDTGTRPRRSTVYCIVLSVEYMCHHAGSLQPPMDLTAVVIASAEEDAHRMHEVRMHFVFFHPPLFPFLLSFYLKIRFGLWLVGL